jgi:hypothetical protein
MCLFYEDDYEEVMHKLVESLRDMRSWSTEWDVPTTSAITQARQRLGFEPLRELFDRCAVPMAEPGTKGAWLAGRRLMAIDGFTLDVADTPENAKEFGRTNGTAQSVFPQVRIAALGECGSRAVVGAALAGCRRGEQTLAAQLLSWVTADMMVIADRNFYSFGLWRQYRATGADLLWRVKADIRLPVLRVLEDGSYLSVVIHGDHRGARRAHLLEAARDGAEVDPDHAAIVRVVEYEVPDREGNGSGELVCVITTILDPNQVGAAELAAAYHERWEAENTIDEIKTHQRGPARILRSKSPNMVKQEIWALLLTHYSVRHLMCRAADEAGIDPDRISFMRSLRIIRGQITRPADFSP